MQSISRPNRCCRGTWTGTWLAMLLAAWAAQPVLAQESQQDDQATWQRPRYDVLRHREDWSGLSDEQRRAAENPFDLIKNIPLTEDGSIRATFGGSVRLRLESWHNFNFAAPPDVKHHDTFLLNRVMLHGDFHVGDHVRVFVEGKSAHVTDRDLVGGRRTLDVDAVDLQNAFIDLMLPLADWGHLTLRGGRQELLLGRQRLVSPLDWANTRRTFDGFSAIVDVHDWKVTGFWTQLVEVRKYAFNPSDAHNEFFGIYAAGKVPSTSIGLDLYWLGLDRQDTVSFVGVSGSEDRHTLGGRLHGRLGDSGLDYELEGAYQLGSVGDTDISAFMVASQLGFQPAGCPASPRLFVGFDYASGGASASEVNTFNQLFPLGHAYLGYVDVIGRQNVMDIHGGVTIKPIDRLTLEVKGHGFWRADRGDAVYHAGGGVLRAGNLGQARRIGAELDILGRYQINRHLEWMAGYSRFFAGPFIRESGPARDIDFIYTALQFTF